MTSPLRRRIRHARRFLSYGALVVLILLATAVGALNQLLPLIEKHPDRIAAWLGERVGEPVSFDRAVGEWTRRGPRFTLDGLRIGRGERVLDIGEAELLVAVYSGLLPGEPLTELKVRDLSLTLVQGEDRRWKLDGLPFREVPGADPLETLERLGELQVERAKLSIRAPRLQLVAELPRVDLRLRVDGDRLVAGVRAWARSGGAPLTAIADLQRGDWSGSLWAGGQDLQLREWSPLLAPSGLAVAGRGHLDLWARIEAQRVMDVRTDADFAPLALVTMTPWLPAAEGAPTAPPVVFARAGVLARWQIDADGDGWQVHAPRLRFAFPGTDDARDGDPEERSLDGLWAAGGERFALQAQHVDLGPARALATLVGAVPPGLRRWLHQAAPDGELAALAIAGTKTSWRGGARFAGVGWQSHDGSPGLHGLAGDAAFDQSGGVIDLEAGPARFEWRGFREPLDVRLDGLLGWWRADDGWHAGAGHLRVRGSDYGATVRAEMHFDPAGSKPRLDLAARVDEAPVPTAGKFWVVGKMPEATIEWLDTALQAGRVTNGRAVLAGDLDFWPFREYSGRFDARARVVEARVQFREDWPAAEALDVDVDFNGPGMSLEGEAAIHGIDVAAMQGAIPDFRDPILSLDVTTATEAAKLQDLMLASPLRRKFEEHLTKATIAGPAQIGVQLVLPLAARLGESQVDGTLALAGGRLADPRWNLEFTDVHGTTRFSDGGFAASDLAVKLDGDPATFTLNVGAEYTGDAALAASAGLRGELPAKALLSRHPPLLWLGDWFAGRSVWNVGVDIPASVAGRPSPPTRLRVESDLVGTTIALPAPLAKDAATPRALTLHAPLPLPDGELTLQLGGDLMAMRARADAAGNLAGRIRFGGGAIDDALPAKGLAIDGRVGTLDAAGWIGFAANDGRVPANATAAVPTVPLPGAPATPAAPAQLPAPPAATAAASAPPGVGAVEEIDLQIANLDLLGSPFADVHAQLRHGGAVTRVQATGAAIAGSVEIPRDLSQGIVGRFERLHWPEKPAPSEAELADADQGRSDDPTRVPALRFDVADLRVGALVLGRTELVAAPIPAGLRIEKFASTSGTLELQASGDWTGAGPGRSRSRFDVQFHAKSMGELLSAFGLSDMVDDGETRGRLLGRWPGSPGAFSLARFDGTMRLDVGEGSLLQVEPGGSGRVLGLISLAEIPRRLTLDFSDFFSKGFAFNTMSGEFAFADGRATTDLLHLNGPAAEIKVSGSTDLRAQTYDQRIEVLPKAGGVLPAIGLVVGGPVGAAAGAVAQAVLQQPLKQAARTVYSVTGPWKEPVVEVIEKGPPATVTPPANPEVAESTH